jgi:hypothetical protein
MILGLTRDDLPRGELLRAPLRLFKERCTEGGRRFADKSPRLWRPEDLAG